MDDTALIRLNGLNKFSARVPVAPPSTQTCVSCRFAAKEESDRVCRFHPPQVGFACIPVMRPSPVRGMPPQQGVEIKTLTQFPVVRDDQWCGQWAPRDAVKESADGPELNPAA